MPWQNVGSPYVVISSSSGLLLVYAPTPGAGNLVASISAVVTTDQYGNTVNEGVWVYGSQASIGLSVLGSVASLLLEPLGLIHGVELPNVSVLGQNIGAVNESMIMVLVSGEETSGGNSYIHLESEPADGSSTAFGALGITGVQILGWNPTELLAAVPIWIQGQNTVPTAVGNQAILYALGGLGGGGNGTLKVVDGTDGVNYATERNTQLIPSGAGINVGNVAPNTTSILAANVGARLYRVSGMLVITATTACAVEFGFTCAASSTGQMAVTIVRGAATIGTGIIPPNALTGVGPALIAGDVYIVYIDGIITPAAFGSLTLVGAVSAAANSFVVAPNSYIDVMPV